MKINKTLSILIFLVSSFSLMAQNQSNDWINYNQKYYKFKIVQDGIYRIPYSTLASAGIPLGSISPENIQLFGRGTEIPIYIYNQTTGAFSAGDFIEFYAQKNDGWYDSALYVDHKYQVKKTYSLFTDTATYYLTWNTSFNNARANYNTATNYSAYTASPYVLKESRADFNNYYLDGMPLAQNISETIPDPEYADGEGFYDNPFYLGGSKSYNLPSAEKYAAGGNAVVDFVLQGASNYRQIVLDHHVKIQFANTTIDTIFEGYKILRFSKSIPTSSLGNSTTTFSFQSINDIGSQADRNAVSYISIKYPHTLNFENSSNFSFTALDGNNGKAYLNISNFNGGNNPVFWDIDNYQKAIVIKNGSNYQILTPNAGAPKRCLLVNSSDIQNINQLQLAGNNGYFPNYIASKPNADFILITHKSLRINSSTLYNADDYAAYRTSKGQNVLLIDIDDLYEQYSYGINKNPMAIRNFLKDAYHNLIEPPKYLFLVGKGYYPNIYRKNATYYNETLIPSFGSPPSDQLLSAHIADTSYVPFVATGRLVAKNLEHIDIYLNKIKQYDDPSLNPPSMWQKKALFFSGGDVASLQTILAGYMNSYQAIYEDTSFGGNVKTFYKTSTDPIQVNLSAQIRTLINGGVNMLNFFGHAAGVGFDISIDNPSEYTNYGKYPFLIANSCFAGDIFQPNIGIDNSSEAFVLIRDKGAIAYLGSVTSGYPSYLNIYTRNFFTKYCQTQYGQAIGKHVLETVKTVSNNLPQIKEVCLEMTLHGDPALKLYANDLPDFVIDESSLVTSPETVTTEKDSFLIELSVGNLGKAVNDSIIIEIERSFPEKQSTQLEKLFVKSPNYMDTFRLWIPIDRIHDVGTNSFKVRVNANSSVSEMDATNNEYTYNVEIYAADLKPVYPPEFAVVGQNAINLIASTFYPLSSTKTYVLQIDTSVYFNSPLLVSQNIVATGGLIEYSWNIPPQDSAVYYWRVSIDSTANGNYNWRHSSFQYISNETGWSQADFFQFENNTYRFAVFNKDKRIFEFINDVKNIKCINGIYPHIGWTEPQYQINNVQFAYWQCVANGMKFAVINPISGVPWYSHNNGSNEGQYGNFHCKNYDYASFEFSTESTLNYPNNQPNISDTAWYQRTSDFIAQIPDGYYVLARSAQNSFVTQWPEHLYKSFDSIGANFIRNIPDQRPYILWGTKGDLGGGTEIIGDSLQAHIVLVDSFNTKWAEGYIESPIIGPASKWNSLNWKVLSQDAINTDSVRLALVSIEADGTLDTVFRDLPPDSMHISKLNDLMPARDFPYCKLICYMKDDSLHTPAYIKYWNVIYSPVPELAIAPKIHYNFHSDTLDQGDSLILKIAYKNISPIDLKDSLLVNYWVKDKDNIHHQLNYRRLAPINGETYLIDSISTSTINLEGNCSFYLEINPVNPVTKVWDQLENDHSNNSLQVPFFVKKDDSNPLLDITFDGVHILDGDIVSANPEIEVSLKDDNPYIVMDDTNAFKVYLSKPGNLARKRVYFYSGGEEQLQFIPAELPDNKAKLRYNPKFDLDGEYTLYVQGIDPAYNTSGTTDYQINFEVVNKSTITHLMNWPNPFTTKTHFVFTLTGSQIPDNMLIQIMTISGKVVREISMEELGNIHIGRNITDFTWDGTDQYGDRLANGVYLYRVISQLNGESIELRTSGADSYFTKSFGKMYLMR